MFLVPLLFGAVLLGSAANVLMGICGPFTDVAADAFCPFVLEIFYVGITTGTTPTTYDPTANVTRLQMAAFLARSVDATLSRGSRRTASGHLWTTQGQASLGLTTVGTAPQGLDFDGADVWVAGGSAFGGLSRVRASDGRLLETWTGAPFPNSVLSAMNRVFVTGFDDPGKLYAIDPSQPAGAVTTVATNLGAGPAGLAFDGAHFWTANVSAGSVSIITPGASIPWTVTTVTVGAGPTAPSGALYDGANIWITDNGLGVLLKLNGSGAVLQTVTVGVQPGHAAFDGSNLWVPNYTAATVTVVRASNGSVLQTLTGNGLTTTATAAAFDGRRVLVTGYLGNAVSLWKAADLSALGSFPTGGATAPARVCSDGIGFWITMNSAAKLAHFQ